MDQNDFMGLLGKVKKLRSSMHNLDESLATKENLFSTDHFTFKLNGKGEIIKLEACSLEAGSISDTLMIDLKNGLNHAFSSIEEERNQALLEIAKDK